MKKVSLLFISVLTVVCSCETSSTQPKPQQPTLLGNWRFKSESYTACTVSTDDIENQCTGTAAQCGVLSFTANTWVRSRLNADGSVFTESGSYSVTSNVITLSGGSNTASSIVHDISGSAFTVTATSLVFITSSVSTGCSITITFIKHNQPFNPIS